MMVLASIYLAVSTSLPTTAMIKPVEIWLLFSLVYPVLVIVINILIQRTKKHQNGGKVERNNFFIERVTPTQLSPTDQREKRETNDVESNHSGNHSSLTIKIKVKYQLGLGVHSHVGNYNLPGSIVKAGDLAVVWSTELLSIKWLILIWLAQNG